jgi:hypothetical protein
MRARIARAKRACIMHRTGETWTEEARRRLVEQFERQAREAFALADEIEQADTIELQD